MYVDVPADAHFLALPVTGSLVPHLALLVLHHPELTDGYFQGFDLYDKHGDMVGLRDLGSGYYLVGYKNRRGAALAEQKIQLNERTLDIVRQLIVLTQPLRGYLKAKGDPAWRQLILSCGAGFAEPIASQRGQNIKADIIASQMFAVSKKDKSIRSRTVEDCERLASRFTLNSLRASAGVLVYLETHSVEKMAKALGHKKYSSHLLRRYLPEAILAFFQERWIRLFQQAFIAHALQNSPLLLEVTRFDSMELLDEFLANHALKTIPEHLEDPYGNLSVETKIKQNTESAENDRIYFDVSVGTLSALISLRSAVEQSERPGDVCGRAHYWAGVGAQLCSHIENTNVTEDLKAVLREAQCAATPELMAEIIYG